MKSSAPHATINKADAPAAGQGVAMVDNRAVAVAQRQALTAIDNSPRQVAQRQQAAAAAPPRNTTGLPDNLKAGVENLSGYSLDDVTVHYNSAKPAQLQAHAYAQGTDIHVAPGQEQHLPHEAWHVVQQKQGRVRPTMQLKGGVNDDARLEAEADVMGHTALQFHKRIRNNQISTFFPLPKVLQGLFINTNNDASSYPHLHTAGQYIGYTYTGGHHTQLRSNQGNIAQGWFQTVGIAIGNNYLHGMNQNQRANHNAILTWISNNEPDVWETRR